MAAIGPAGAETLARLTYRSKATARPGSPSFAKTLEAILRQAWTKNPRHGITGVLLLDGAFFLQVIEGPSREVESLYEAIARDSRHDGIDLIDFLAAEARDYENFSMAFLDVTAGFPELQSVMQRTAKGVASPLRQLISEALSAGQLKEGWGSSACPSRHPGTISRLLSPSQ